MAKIAADKEERRRKAEQAKAQREGHPVPDDAAETTSAATATAAAERPAHAQARLRLQTPSGNIMKTLPVETTLFEVAQMIEQETGSPVSRLSTTFPKKTWSGPVDFGMTLKEAGLTPSAVVVVE